MCWNKFLKSQLYEKTYPYIISVIVTAFYTYMNPDFPEKEAIISSGITIGAIFCGFLVTSSAILISSKESDLCRKLDSAEYKDTLFSYINQAILFSLLFCIWSMIGYFIVGSHEIMFSIIWVFIGMLTISTFYRFTHIIFKIFKKL